MKKSKINNLIKILEKYEGKVRIGRTKESSLYKGKCCEKQCPLVLPK